MRRSWPGNVRELQNLISRAVLLCEDTWIRQEDLGQEQDCPSLAGLGTVPLAWAGLDYRDAKRKVLEQFNGQYLCQALETAGGNVTVAAKTCGIERQAFQRLMRRYDIDSKRYRG